MSKKITDSSISEALDWLEKNKKSPKYTFDESELNAFAYRVLYELTQPNEATRVFDINVELFPKSSNIFDSAGEAYLVSNEYEKSITHYKKSIELNGRAQFHQLGYVKPKLYTPTKLPKDTKELFVQEGNWENEFAFVYVQGGPDLQLNMGPRDGLHLMPNEGDLLKIYPLQSQMINPDMLTCNPVLTDEQSAAENKKSVEILDRVINYLVANKKQVFLIGHSYGSSICMEYVHAKKNLAKKVVLMGLDLDEDIGSWNTLKSGEYIRWNEGVTPFSRVVFGEIPENHRLKPSFDRVADNLTALVKHNMQKKYSKLYSDDDFKHIISIFATQDEANGKKSPKEIEVLKRKGAIVVEVEGNHHGMLNSEVMSALYKHLIEGNQMANKY